MHTYLHVQVSQGRLNFGDQHSSAKTDSSENQGFAKFVHGYQSTLALIIYDMNHVQEGNSLPNADVWTYEYIAWVSDCCGKSSTAE